MSFMPDYPNAIVVEAHYLNWYGPNNPNSYKDVNGKVQSCTPKGIFYHTPEESSDNYESTPFYFAKAFISPYGASTHFYSDNDGDFYQMVPQVYGAVANGNDPGKKPWWATTGISLNLQTTNVEIEGYAATLKNTMTSRQWSSLVDWSVYQCVKWGIPADRSHLMAHYEVSSQRNDPGPWLLDQSGFVQEVGDRVTKYEQDIKDIKAQIIGLAIRDNQYSKLLSDILTFLCKGDHNGALAYMRTLNPNFAK